MRQFDPTLTNVEPFYLGSKGHVSTKVDTHMMHIDGIFRTGNLEALDARVLELPYKGNQLSMLIVLPNKIGDLNIPAVYQHVTYCTTVFSGFFKISLLGSDNPVAIKRIQRSDLSLKEVEIMKKTSDKPNPYILRLIHMEMTNDFLYLATELCSGTLCDYVNKIYEGSKFKGEWEILLQVTQGLAYLHQLGIVHRDIKPLNILIFSPPSLSERDGFEAEWNDSETFIFEPKIKLADFGISKALHVDKKDFTNTNVTNPNGTRGWMAPEVYQIERPDSKVDIFPLGCIFAYTLSGGKHPFGDDSDQCIVRIKNQQPMLIVQQDLITPYSGDGVAFQLIESMLQMDPSKRPNVEKVLDSEFFLMFPVEIQVEGRTQKLLDICSSIEKKNTINDCNLAYGQLKYLLQNGKVNVNGTTSYVPWFLNYRESPLHLLCKYYKNDNLIDLATLLIQYGANINAKNDNGSTPLHSLCEHYKNKNLIDLVKLLLENGADVNATSRYSRLTPLHLLIKFHKNENIIELVQLLINNGADVNAKDEYGDTPLHYLCQYYKNDSLLIYLVQLLIKNEAEVNAKTEYSKRTPLHNLCEYYKNDNLIELFKLLIQNGTDVKAMDVFGSTPLHSICKWYEKDNLIELVKLLVKNGANVNAKRCSVISETQIEGDVFSLFTKKRQGYDVTPLHDLCRYYKNSKLIMDIVKIMTDNGANINSVASMLDPDEKKTPLEMLRNRGISV